MYVTLIANIVNVFFNYVFIFGKFGFPMLGIIGAAYGTLISRLIMMFLIWILFSSLKSTRLYLKNLNFFVLDFSIMRKISS